MERAGGSLWNYWYDSGEWDAAEIVSSGVLSFPTAVLQPNDSPSVFFIGTGGSLWNYAYASGTWVGTEIATTGTANGSEDNLVAAPVVLERSGWPLVFVNGGEAEYPPEDYSGIWEYSDSSSGWSSQEVISGDIGLASGVLGTSAAPGEPTLFGGGPVSSNEETSSLYQAPAWTASPLPPNGCTYSQTLVTLQPGGDPSLFCLGAYGLWNSWYANSSWLSAEIPVPTAPVAIAVTLQPNGSPSVLYRGIGPFGGLWNTWYLKGSWVSGEVSGQNFLTYYPTVPDYPMSVTIQPTGSPSVFVVDPNGGLANYWYVNGVWYGGTVVSSGVGIPQVSLPPAF